MIKKENLFGRKILITGINGFVGSHLARKLRELGADVYGISRSIETKDKILKASILDFSAINKFMKKSKIEICFHLAGKSLVEDGQKDPDQTFKTNIEGALNILESARQNNLKRIIIASTAHIYGNNKLPYLETYAPRPSRPYETSKACVDLIAQSYITTFHLPILIPRFVNIYGPGDLNFSRLIPQTMKAISLGHAPKMWKGDTVRDYLFIDDAIDAYICLAEINLALIGDNKVFNFGSGSKISVENLIKKIILLAHKPLIIKKVDVKRTSEIKLQYVSFNKAKKILSWNPKVSLEQGLKKTLVWYQEYFRKKTC